MAVVGARPRVAVRNIAVATDFSPESDLAIKYAAAIARHFGSRMHLVHALEPSLSKTVHAGTLWGNETEAEARAKLRREAQKCGELACAEWLLKGTPVQVVERMLSLDDIDLVIIGTRASKGFRKVAIGSAAEQFFRQVHCPVMAIGPLAGPAPVSWRPRNLLLATDLQSDEALAARCAVFLAREHDAKLALLHVADPSAAPFPADQQATSRAYFQSRLRELLSYRPGLDYPAEFWVEFGEDAPAEILRVARDREVDLLVLSVHREEPWGFHFVHEAYRIVAEAPCPVLITQRQY